MGCCSGPFRCLTSAQPAIAFEAGTGLCGAGSIGPRRHCARTAAAVGASKEGHASLPPQQAAPANRHQRFTHAAVRTWYPGKEVSGLIEET